MDLTGTLAAGERDAIAARLAAFETARGSQVVVLLVPSIGTEAIEEFATRVTDEWKLGRAGVDDGVLFVFKHTKEENEPEELEMGGKVRATPAAANGTLFILTESKTKLYAVSESK